MRAYKRFDKRGFTLVELMIVVAIIGVLAALAIYGVNRYLASAKTAEAKNTIGAITRAAVDAYERESYSNEIVGDGTFSSAATHALCTSAAQTPGTVPKGTKYQPSTDPAKDFNIGTNLAGWKCLKFSMTQPIYYAYNYEFGAGTAKSGAAAGGFEASATGDLNGNSKNSFFARGAVMRDKQIVLSTSIYIEDEFE